jgi:hypothetical protein
MHLCKIPAGKRCKSRLYLLKIDFGARRFLGGCRCLLQILETSRTCNGKCWTTLSLNQYVAEMDEGDRGKIVALC